jgi:Response regulators consisting of a CheY-like receiver domain and a winged-helix DNA-binding domain
VAKKILIVDDEPDIITTIEMMLESSNYTTITAQDGQEALEKVEKHSPDLLVLDINMPKVDGYTVFKKLRADPKFRDIPIIILTANTEYGDVKKCITEGVEAYLTKPFKTETLLGLMKGLLGE